MFRTIRSLHLTAVRLAPQVDSKALEAKKALKKTQKLRTKHKRDPTKDLLYMEIPKALKYLRASEVGEPVNKSTISLLVTVIPEKGAKNLNGFLDLPHPVGKSKFLIFSNKTEELKSKINLPSENYLIGGKKLLEEIEEGIVDLNQFTHSFCTFDMQNNLKPYGRILASKNLMCTPKKGNVDSVENLPKLIEKGLSSVPFKQVNYEIAFPVGKCNFSDEQILKNIEVASKTIYGLEPHGSKKTNVIGQTVISSTKGPGIVIDFRQ